MLFVKSSTFGVAAMALLRVLGPLTATVKNGEITRLDAEYDRKDPQTAKLLDLIQSQTTTPTT